MKITFSSKLSTFVVRAPEGTLISLSAPPTELGDGVYAVGDSGIVLVDEEYQTDTIYLSTEGEDYTVETGERICYPAEDIIVWGGNAPDRNPFPKSGKGGGGSGGDNTHYKGTTTTAIENGSTTNPITIDGESYTAVFGDIVVYGYTEFVFDGTTWSEFGRPFDTTPTSGSANAVTSDGVYKATPFLRATGARSVKGGEAGNASGNNAFAFGIANQAPNNNMVAFGKYNSSRTGDLFNIGNGTGLNARSNILEVNDTSANVNGDIKCHNLVVPVGGYEETVLYEMTDYTIPQQTSVTLSDDATNYDSIVVFGIFKSNSSSTNFWRTRARADIMVRQYDFTKELPDTFLLHNSNESASIAGNYCFSDTSTITKTSGDLTWIEKVIGIKYPKLYVPPVSLNQAPATLLPNQTEEPTDEMR